MSWSASFGMGDPFATGNWMTGVKTYVGETFKTAVMQCEVLRTV